LCRKLTALLSEQFKLTKCAYTKRKLLISDVYMLTESGYHFKFGQRKETNFTHKLIICTMHYGNFTFFTITMMTLTGINTL